MVWSALKDDRSSKSDLGTIWLAIANAYPSFLHRLIFFALKRYGVIIKYYINVYSKSVSLYAPSNWHRHMRGIFAGCTLSIILFLVVINIIHGYTLLAPAYIKQSVTPFNKGLYRRYQHDVFINVCYLNAVFQVFCSTKISCHRFPCPQIRWLRDQKG